MCETICSQYYVKLAVFFIVVANMDDIVIYDVFSVIIQSYRLPHIKVKNFSPPTIETYNVRCSLKKFAIGNENPRQNWMPRIAVEVGSSIARIIKTQSCVLSSKVCTLTSRRTF